MAHDDASPTRATLLMVDDEQTHLAVGSKILGRSYRVVTANGGEEALAMVQQVQPDVALVDYRMPGPSGNEVLERFASLVPRCLRMLVTGDSDRSTLQEAINRGRIYRFVSKPVVYPTLLEDIRLALEHRRAQDLALNAERLALAGLTSCIAAHDIRNGLQGLAAVPMYIKLGTPEDLVAAIAAAHYAQTIMSDCVEEILAVSKGNTPQLRRAQVALPQLVERIVSYEAQAIAERTFISDIDPTVPSVSLSETHCRRLVGNLIRNASQATGPGGIITVKVWCQDLTWACVSIGDNGPGIPPEVQAKIFQPFNTTKGEGGSGFGLKMCRDVMEAHQGTLTFATTSQGTIFTASFPLRA